MKIGDKIECKYLELECVDEGKILQAGNPKIVIQEYFYFRIIYQNVKQMPRGIFYYESKCKCKESRIIINSSKMPDFNYTRTSGGFLYVLGTDEELDKDLIAVPKDIIIHLQEAIKEMAEDITRTEKMKCKHENAKEVGQTMYKGFLCLVYWCKDCGAIRKEYVSGSYKTTKWEIPKN